MLAYNQNALLLPVATNVIRWLSIVKEDDDMRWTEERIELLKGMWAEGVSPGLIGKRLRLNIDAVVGKAARIGLEARLPVSKNMFFRASPGGPYREKTVAAVIQLKGSMCKWPEGDPGNSGFRFCGRSKRFMAPYCNHHMAIAYNPAARRER